MKPAWRRDASMLLVAGAVLALAALCVPSFASWVNVKGLLLSVSTVGLVACTMVFCLASGSFDLSVGSTVACSGVLAAVVMRETGSVSAGCAAALGAGALVGAVNGVAIARARINALIATLATMQIVRGAGYIVSGGEAVGISRESFFALGNARWAGVPVPVALWLFALVVLGLALARTTFGRAALAIGGNEEAAHLAGIPVARVKIAVFTLQGVMAAFAGLVLAARMTSGQPTCAQGLELEVISACVLGGVSLSGGVGSMSSVVAGVLVMGTVQNAMNLLGVEPFWQYVARGAILLGAVGLDRLRR